MINFDILKLRFIKAGLPEEIYSRFVAMYRKGIFSEIQFDGDEIPPEENFLTLAEVYKVFLGKGYKITDYHIKTYLTIPYSQVRRVRVKLNKLFGAEREELQELYKNEAMFFLNEKDVVEVYELLRELDCNKADRWEIANRVFDLGIADGRERIEIVRRAVEKEDFNAVVVETGARGVLFFPSPFEPLKGIEYLSARFPKKTVAKILINELMLLVCFQEEGFVESNGKKEHYENEINKILSKYT